MQTHTNFVTCGASFVFFFAPSFAFLFAACFGFFSACWCCTRRGFALASCCFWVANFFLHINLHALLAETDRCQFYPGPVRQLAVCGSFGTRHFATHYDINAEHFAVRPFDIDRIRLQVVIQSLTATKHTKNKDFRLQSNKSKTNQKANPKKGPTECKFASTLGNDSKSCSHTHIPATTLLFFDKLSGRTALQYFLVPHVCLSFLPHFMFLITKKRMHA